MRAALLMILVACGTPPHGSKKITTSFVSDERADPLAARDAGVDALLPPPLPDAGIIGDAAAKL